MLALLALALSSSMAPQETVADGPSHLGAYLSTISGLPRPVAAAFGPSEGRPNALFIATRGDTSRPPAVQVFEVSADPERSTSAVGQVGVGRLERPVGLAVSDDGDVFVTDELQRMLWRFPSDGGDPVAAAASAALTLPAGVDVTGIGEAQLVVVADPGAGSAKLFRGGALTPTAIGEALLVRPRGACFIDGPDGAVQIAVCDGATHRIHVFDLDGGNVVSFSQLGPHPSLLSGPSDVEFADGKIFVADRENHRVQAFDAGATMGELAYRFGVHAIRPGEGAGALHYPAALGVSGDGLLLALAEPMDDRVQLFGRAPGAEPIEDPSRAAIGPPSAHFGPSISGSGIYLATVSPESHQIQIHDLRGKEPAKISDVASYGTRFGMFRTPCATWLSSAGRSLLTVDEGNARLTRSLLRVEPQRPLNADPELTQHLDGVDLAAAAGRPFWPGAVTVLGPGTKNEVILVTDRVTDSVLMLDGDLETIGVLSGDEESGPIRGIADLSPAALGTASTILVVDSGGQGGPGAPGGRIIEFGPAGGILRTFGEGVLVEPGGVASRENQIWVTDRATDRVECFERRPGGAIEHTGGFGGRGLGPGQFHDPRGIHAMDDGRLIVLDHGNHRGQIFDPDHLTLIAGFGGRLYIEPLKSADTWVPLQPKPNQTEGEGR